MAIKHLANLDLNNNEIKNVKIDVVTSDPSSNLAEGRIIYNSQEDLMKFYDGSAWVSMKNVDTDVDVNVTNLKARLPQISDSFTIGDATDVTVTTSGDLTVTGDLTVNGTTTTVNTATLDIEDNIITLNKNQTGTPAVTLRSGIEVERGDSTNVKFQFNELIDKWQFTEDGTTFYNLVQIQDASETVKGIVELATTTEATTGTDTARAVTPAGLAAHNAARSFAVNLEASNSAVTKSTNTYTVTHGLATRDVVAQVYETASPYETVQVDIARATTGTITVAFADTVTDGDYRVLITKID
tara:strand:- start:1318 stop:2214 length:897 start_codon:yes stop_codon:yes gene_type:complete